ncbi:transferrin-binding protein-like solute binding protein, partial [Psychrobacter sp. ANT_H3]|uniref:transferrin-binding protein-like solute binding protein n=1 Tax=Psychrobacter sp. ANT_H3 TaxID=3019444 RepID=UPI0022F1AB41
ATAAKAQAELEKQKAATAQAEADKAKGELITAQDKLAAAEKALADALANGSGDTAALQAEVDRRKAALEAANVQITAAQQAQAAATAAAEAQIAAANQAAQAAKDALAAATIKNAAEAKKSGVQSLNINAGSLGLFNTTTRDFAVNEDGSAVDARADIASQNPDGTAGLLPLVPITLSGEGDTAVADSNGFKAHKGKADIVVAAIGQTLPLTYTSTYKDFGDDMRIGHIDGSAEVALLNKTLPVNGVAVIGNATQAANMPKEGTVGYTGDATYRKLGIGNDIEFGKSVFTADFVAKNVKGDLTFANAGKIGLTAGINGNQFSGTAADNAGYSTEGGFFGGDAQYLGGVYAGNEAQGTYGAKSDKQTAAEKAAAKAQADAAKANADKDTANAQAAAAQAAADKAQADAVKAQEALKKAEDALANAGNGEDQLAAALARAAAAEAAQAAAEAAAATAKAAETAALLAKTAAENAATAAQVAADKAIGDAKVEADKKVAAANQQAADAKA